MLYFDTEENFDSLIEIESVKKSKIESKDNDLK